MSRLLTYPSNGYRAIDCPQCRQEVRVDLHGDQLRFACRGQCGADVAALVNSDQIRDELRERSRGELLRFVWAAELRAAAPPEPPWVWRGYAARGAVVLVAGKPKTGKSTFLCALIEAVAAAAPSFLGRPVWDGPVVYISEEGAGTLAHKLPASDRVRVLARDAAWPLPAWPALVEAAVAEAERIGAVMLAVDALSFWAGLEDGQENDAGAVQATSAS